MWRLLFQRTRTLPPHVLLEPLGEQGSPGWISHVKSLEGHWESPLGICPARPVSSQQEK